MQLKAKFHRRHPPAMKFWLKIYKKNKSKNVDFSLVLKGKVAHRKFRPVSAGSARDPPVDTRIPFLPLLEPYIVNAVREKSGFLLEIWTPSEKSKFP